MTCRAARLARREDRVDMLGRSLANYVHSAHRQGEGWRSDCPKCVASKFVCDEHFARDAVEKYRAAHPEIAAAWEKRP